MTSAQIADAAQRAVNAILEYSPNDSDYQAGSSNDPHRQVTIPVKFTAKMFTGKRSTEPKKKEGEEDKDKVEEPKPRFKMKFESHSARVLERILDNEFKRNPAYDNDQHYAQQFNDISRTLAQEKWGRLPWYVAQPYWTEEENQRLTDEIQRRIKAMNGNETYAQPTGGPAMESDRKEKAICRFCHKPLRYDAQPECHHCGKSQPEIRSGEASHAKRFATRPAARPE